MAGFLARPEDVGNGELVLRDGEAHHLARVRRLGVGDRAEATDGRGRLFIVEVIAIDEERIVCRILEARVDAAEPPVRLCLAPALIKGSRFDLVVEKATELGVDAIAPLLTERGVVRPTPEKVERWERVARAAAKQSGRSRLPAIASPAPLAAVLTRIGDGQGLMAVPGQRAAGLRQVLAGRAARALLLLVGPEGGFTPDEEGLAAAAGVERFSWGWTTLRAETACLVLAALVLHEAAEARP
ncbi:MAG: RsmE family RNA methyltransferase [Candidatus Latescibacterota bacterium]